MALVTVAVSVPRRAETLAVLLDHAHIGHTIVAFDGAWQDDHVRSVNDFVVAMAEHHHGLGAFVMATVRPGHRPVPTTLDERTWFDLRCDADDVGLDLLDWFLVTDHHITSMVEVTDSHRLWLDGS
jgi:hypothetical protein